MAEILVLYYSAGGSVRRMAELIAEGAERVAGVVRGKLGQAAAPHLLELLGQFARHGGAEVDTQGVLDTRHRDPSPGPQLLSAGNELPV